MAAWIGFGINKICLIISLHSQPHQRIHCWTSFDIFGPLIELYCSIYPNEIAPMSSHLSWDICYSVVPKEVWIYSSIFYTSFFAIQCLVGSHFGLVRSFAQSIIIFRFFHSFDWVFVFHFQLFSCEHISVHNRSHQFVSFVVWYNCM